MTLRPVPSVTTTTAGLTRSAAPIVSCQLRTQSKVWNA